MISFLHGTLVEKTPSVATLDVHGVGYEVFISLSTYDRLPASGSACRLLTYHHIREDAQITKTEPTVRNVGSNTFQKILNWMDDTGLGKLTKAVGGGPLLHAAEFVHTHHEAGKAV